MSWSGCVWRACPTILLVDRVHVVHGACLGPWTRLREMQTSTVTATSRARTLTRPAVVPKKGRLGMQKNKSRILTGLGCLGC